MQAKRFLPWELFWQITPEGSTQILDGAWVSVGEEGKEICALKWIFFFKGDKTGEFCWTETQCGFWVAPHEPAAHFPCCKEGKSVSEISQRRGIAGSSLWAILRQVCVEPGKPWPQLLGAPALMQTKSQSAGTSWSKVCEKSHISRWLGNLGVCLPASREDAEQVGWQEMRRMGMLKCFKLCLIFHRSHGEHCRSSRVAEKLKANWMFVIF